MRQILLISLGLVAITLAAYWSVGNCAFVNLDDDAYVEFQPMVNQGFRSAALVWAFSAAHSGMWHPVTTLSHMLDCEVFGVRASPMHAENLAWHLINVVLVFTLLRALTGAVWRAALVAAIFAVHPLDVESVAWISERKNLLSTCFWLLGLGAYVGYVRQPSVARYLLIVLGLALALFSKPMAVTFPATLLLLDFWPLRRWPERPWRALIAEKIPLFVLCLGHGLVTFLAQHSIGAERYGQRFSLGERVGNALVSCVRYLGKAVWPESLSPFYPHPGQWPFGAVAGSVVFLGLLSAAAWRYRHQRPWFLFGELWFLVTLVPVIGLIQVGAQAMADRYTYVPLLGIYIAAVWGAAEFASSRPKTRTLFVTASLTGLAACVFLTRRQLGAWTNSTALYEHSIAVGEDNATVRYLLAVALRSAGKPETEVAAQFRRALEIQPNYVNALTQLALIDLQYRRIDEARNRIETTVRLEPDNPGLHFNLGSLYQRLGRLDEAVVQYEQALRINPSYAGAHAELGRICLQQKRIPEARSHFEAVVHATPWDTGALNELGAFLCNTGSYQEAGRALERAIWIKPDFTKARENLQVVQRALDLKRQAK